MRRAASAGNQVAPTSRRRAEQQVQRRSAPASAIRCSAKLAGGMEQPTNSKTCRTGRPKSSNVGARPAFHSTALFSGPAVPRVIPGIGPVACTVPITKMCELGRIMGDRPAPPSPGLRTCAGQREDVRKANHRSPRALRRVLHQVGRSHQRAASNPPNTREHSTKCGAGQVMVPWYQRASARRCWICPGELAPIGAKLCAPRHVSDQNQQENSAKS